ncbi:hypothetical protein [Streptomyces sp. NPDC018693]|uniref:hypothetical protein n=1 Tax=unclassified Streptomyces TaxID=2593676 RepID=UPI0037BA2453
MSFVLLNARLFAGGADLTGNSNKVEVTSEVEEKPTTNYYSEGWKEVVGGLAAAELMGEGQWEAGHDGMVDDASWAQLGAVGAWTAGPDGSAVGDLAYFMKALRSSYKLGDAVGEVAPWTGSAKSAWPLVRGVVAHPPGTARSSTGDGTAQELGAIAAGQRLYAALHVLSVSGTSTPTITVAIESDSQSDFAGTPETRLTFDAATARSGQLLRTDAAAHADTWYRPTWTITGTDPSFLFVVAFGIR